MGIANLSVSLKYMYNNSDNTMIMKAIVTTCRWNVLVQTFSELWLKFEQPFTYMQCVKFKPVSTLLDFTKEEFENDVMTSYIETTPYYMLA